MMTLDNIARAFADISRSLPASQLPAACDEVIKLLVSTGHARDLARFPRRVEAYAAAAQTSVSVTVTSVSGRAADSEAFLPALEKALHKDVDIENRQDPSLIGGVVLRIRDDRFDASARGALDRFAATLPAIA